MARFSPLLIFWLTGDGTFPPKDMFDFSVRSRPGVDFRAASLPIVGEALLQRLARARTAFEDRREMPLHRSADVLTRLDQGRGIAMSGTARRDIIRACRRGERKSWNASFRSHGYR